MKYLLLGLIQLYWKLIPIDKRMVCLFRESCSNYIYRITKQNGLIKGLIALRYRTLLCKPKYLLIKHNESFELKLNDGTILNQDEISIFLLPPYNYKFNINND